MSKEIIVNSSFATRLCLVALFITTTQHAAAPTEALKNVARKVFSSSCVADPALEEIQLDPGITRNQWRPIQTKIKDTVVQIFSQIAEFDWLQPYRTPTQYTTRASGFFIDADGHLITNAHAVDQAIAIWIQIPSLGKRLIEVSIVSICPERDLALLKINDEDLAYVKTQIGTVPYLTLGDSDAIYRADEVLALGYPLGQESLKSTSGVVSGREQNYIQISAPINPGNSGGPLLNTDGLVIGINSAGITEAQNIGYAIPVNDLKVILSDLQKVTLLRKPFLGVMLTNATETLTKYLGNPEPGGCYVTEVLKNSPLDKAGVQSGDMIYEINNHRLDVYGEMIIPWNEDKISLIDYVSRLELGQDVELVIYRNGERKAIKVEFTHSQALPIRKVYPGYENIDYEVFGGMVVMELTMNHIKLLINHAPGLARYTESKNQADSVLIITHIFPNSQLYRARTITAGSALREINGISVKNLADFRQALHTSIETNYLVIKAADTVTRASDNLLVALPFDKITQEQVALAKDFRFPISDAIKDLLLRASK